MPVHMGSGSPTARVMLVGEAWGEMEEKTGVPFSGNSGLELNRMLAEAGILRSDCYATNVVNARPLRNDISTWIPEEAKRITGRMVERQGKWVDPIVAEGLEMLGREIGLVCPRVIVALGATALWALTGNSSIVKWRGSLLEYDQGGKVRGAEAPLERVRVIPTYHPAAILRMWDWRAVAVLDLKRVARELESPSTIPDWNIIVKPTFEMVLRTLEELQSRVEAGPVWVELDLETKVSHIDCCGLSWSALDGICIPFMSRSDIHGYWLEHEEALIIHRLYRLLTHRNCWVRGQNLLYDCQYTYRHWGFVPNVKQDTMISHHTLWAGLPKNLAFQASMYCGWYQNWKPDKDTWKEGG